MSIGAEALVLSIGALGVIITASYTVFWLHNAIAPFFRRGN